MVYRSVADPSGEIQTEISTFLEQRGSKHAEVEIRRLANEVLRILKGHSPNLFSDYRETELPDGTFALFTPYPKI